MQCFNIECNLVCIKKIKAATFFLAGHLIQYTKDSHFVHSC